MLKVAFILGKFPSLSETFILDQIIGLIDNNCMVDVYAEFNPLEKVVHDDVMKYNLLEKVTYYKPVKIYSKIIKILKALLTMAIQKPRKTFWFLNYLVFNVCLKFSFFHIRNINYIWDNIKWVLLLETQLLRKKYDIIHCHFGPNGVVGAYLKQWGVQGQFITSFYGYDLTSYLHQASFPIYSFLFKTGDFFLPICQYFKKIIINLGCDEKKIKVHHIGIYPNKFSITQEKIDNFGPIILSIGRLVEKKGIHYSIKAISKLLPKFPDLKLRIAGDGPLRKFLENMVEKLRLHDHVFFLGTLGRNEIHKLYEESDIFLLPSVTSHDGDQEGTPTVIMEAQAMQLPVIATEHAGNPEIVKNQISGILVREKDVEGLAAAIEKLISSQSLRIKMGIEGHKIIVQQFNENILNKDLISVYNDLIKK